MPAIPMRRPLSIMRADASAGWIEMLYKVVGSGLHALAARKAGDTVSVLGPIGQGFTPHRRQARARCSSAAAWEFRRWCSWPSACASDTDAPWKPLVLMGSEIPFPFRARPSQILVAGIPAGAIACMPMLDEWGIASRLASKRGFPGLLRRLRHAAGGCLAGLARARASSREVEIFSCGPTPMLQATAAVARKHDVPCQVSLEEFMACAVGGCAGLHGARSDGRRAGDEARLRRRPGVRRLHGLRCG